MKKLNLTVTIHGDNVPKEVGHIKALVAQALGLAGTELGDVEGIYHGSARPAQTGQTVLLTLIFSDDFDLEYYGIKELESIESIGEVADPANWE